MFQGPAGGAGRDVPHGLEEALDQVGRGGVWTLGETSLNTHHDRVSLPAIGTVGSHSESLGLTEEFRK